MRKRPLTAEQVELLHHVELSEAGWQERVVDQFVLSTCLAATGGLSEDEIRQSLSGVLEVGAVDQVRRSVQRLLGAKSIVELERGRLSISEVTRRAIAHRQRSAEEIDATARQAWEEIVARNFPTRPSAIDWKWFCDRVLGPLVRAQGVRVYELLVSRPGDEDGRDFLGFLDGLSEDDKAPARKSVLDYLASQQSAVREYVLRRLHAHLLSLAVGLPAGSLDAFQGGGRRTVQLKLLLDTNFLFSLLGLHENPSNEAAGDLVGLLQAVKSHVTAVLYVTPLTVDEVRRTLTAYETKLDQIWMTPKLGEIATSFEGEFSGIALKYFEAAKRAKKRMSAAEYLGPYLSDLLTVLRARGIELYNENLDDLSASQPVVDDILAQQQYESANSKRKPKSYEAHRHDVTLWHLIRNRRPSRVDAPLDAVYWIATVDYRYLGYDAYKRRGETGSVPVCVHPATLVQMLQLWLPRSPRMDAALFDTLRSSIPNRFDSEAEEMSLRILRALSRYEDVDDLPEGTVTAILMNQALRQRMGAATDADAQAALVRDEIVQAAASARSELSREQARVQALQEELDRARTIASRDAATAGESVLRAKEGIKELEAKLVAERTVSANLERRLAAIEGTLDSERIERQNERTRADQTRTRALFVVGSGVGLLVALALVWWTWSHGPAAAIPWRWRLAAAAGIIVAATLCVFLAGGQILAVRSWPVFVRCKKFYMTTSWAVILGVLVNALWDFLKK